MNIFGHFLTFFLHSLVLYFSVTSSLAPLIKYQFWPHSCQQDCPITCYEAWRKRQNIGMDFLIKTIEVYHAYHNVLSINWIVNCIQIVLFLGWKSDCVQKMDNELQCTYACCSVKCKFIAHLRGNKQKK